MRRIILVFTLIAVALADISEAHLRNGYFHRRSPTVHIMGKKLTGGKDMCLLRGVEAVPSQVDITDMGNLISTSFWVGKLKENSGIPMTADLPSAALFMFNFGLDTETLQSLPGLQELKNGRTLVDMSVPYYPADDVSAVTSALTGNYPRTHGIIASSWREKGQDVDAFSEERHSAAHVSVYDLMQLEYPNVQVTAATSDPLLSKALAQGQFPATRMRDGAFVSGNPALQFAWQDAAESLQTSLIWTDLKEQVAALNLDDAPTRKFLMEMELLNRATALFQASADPQLFAFATTSMKEMDHSDPAVTSIFSHIVANFLFQFDRAFPAGVSQAAFIQEPTQEAHAELESKLSSMGYDHIGDAILKPKELSTACDTTDALCFTSSTITMGQNETTYQIRFWIAFYSFLLVLFFSCWFCTITYSDDALLFTKWSRQT